MLNERIGGIKAKSVYVGGGTPSFLSTRQARDLLGHLRSEIDIADETDISFDLHPNTIHQVNLKEKLAALRDLGVNRIPIGGVDLNDEVLYLQHRGHKSKDTVELIQRLKLEGFDYVVTDLMMGVPGQTPENWEKTLDILIDICEIDCAMTFPLMFKASAQIFNTYARSPEMFPSIEDRTLMHIIAQEKFGQAGYSHDPLYYFNRNNDAKSDQQVAKFKNLGLLGIGITAFGYVNGHQYFNLPDRRTYRKSMETGKLPIWRASKLTPRQLFERDIMFGLKLADGIDAEDLKTRHGLDVYREYEDSISSFERAGLMESDGDKLRMTWKGNLFSEEITDSFAGDDIRHKAESVAATTSPKSPVQRYNYNMIGHRVR
jgi:oxygen-independent coproporphyrinogen-3 oxidase